jgi:hypothetical protein
VGNITPGSALPYWLSVSLVSGRHMVTVMRWIKRMLLAAPFIVALLLNVLMVRAGHLHLYRESQHIAGYGFLFGTPWSWIVDRIWFGLLDGIWRGHIHNWMRESLGYLAVLWIPAALYSAFLWLVLTGIQIVRTRYAVRTHSADDSAAST